MTVPNNPPAAPALRRKQRARVAALIAARDVLTAPQGFATRSVPKAGDLIAVACYITDGNAEVVGE